MPDAAVIFDVDGPLLELTTAEEDRFFAPLRAVYGLKDMSRDWDSYRIRNDVEIYREILEQHVAPMDMPIALKSVAEMYVAALEEGYADGSLDVVGIPGARELLERLSGHPAIALGIATANFGAAARVRLTRANMWSHVQHHPGAAEYGGAKKNILARVIEELDVPKSRIIFLGDNLNDLEAGTENEVHFIGFHVDAARRQRLSDAGAKIVSGDHDTTWQLISEIFDLA